MLRGCIWASCLGLWFNATSPMPKDPAHQLQALYVAGFELQTFERYPKAIGVSRGECLVMLVPGPDGLQMLGTPGWRIGEDLAVLTTVSGRPAFQHKDRVVEATEQRREALVRFRDEVRRILDGSGDQKA